MNKPLDRNNHDESAGHIDFRYQSRDKGNLETPAFGVDHKPVLGASDYQAGHLAHVTAVWVSDVETDEVFGPEFIVTQLTALGSDHVVAPNRLSGNPGIDTHELEVMAAVGAANRSHFVLSTVDEYRFPWLEMNQVILVYIEADVPVESVGSPQTANDETGLSR